MAGYYNQILAVVLLGLAASACSARQLFAAAGDDVEPSVFVASSETRSMVPSLAPLLEKLQLDPNLMESALKCSEATGIADVAGALPEVLYGAINAFAQYGFCGLPNQKEQTDRLSYMATYSVSIHLRSIFLSQYLCTGLQGLPSECEFGNLVADAVAAAAVHYRGDPLCVEAASDGTTNVQLLTLPADWKAAAPAFTCEPRPVT